jgi:hypothetical protein
MFKMRGPISGLTRMGTEMEGANSRMRHSADNFEQPKKELDGPTIIWDTHICERGCSFTTWEDQLPGGLASRATKRCFMAR